MKMSPFNDVWCTAIKNSTGRVMAKMKARRCVL